MDSLRHGEVPSSSSSSSSLLNDQTLDPTYDQLVAAAAEGDLNSVRKYLDSGVPVDYGNAMGETALIAACKGGYARVVSYLVEKGKALVDARFANRGDGWTALMFAGFYGRLSIIRYLIESKADFTLRNNEGLTVMEIVPCMNATFAEVQETVSIAIATLAKCERDRPRLVTFGDVAGGTGGLTPGISRKEDEKTGTKGKDGQGGSGSGTSFELARWQQQQRQGQHVTYDITNIAAARPRMIDVYQATCGDFQQQPSQHVIAALLDSSNDVPETGLGAFVLTGFNPVGDVAPNSGLSSGPVGDGSARGLGDLGVVPLLETLNHSFPNAPLHSLELSYLSLTDRSAQSIAVFLTKSKFLASVSLEGNDLTAQGVSVIAKALRGKPMLRSFVISHNPIGDAGTAELLSALSTCPSLSHLDIKDTRAGCSAMVAAAKILSQNNSFLEEVDLSCPLFTSPYDDTPVIHLAKAIQYSKVRALFLSKLGITDRGAMFIADALSKNNTIYELDLSSNRISPTGVSHLVRGLKRRRMDCFISLDFNDLADQMVDEIDRAILEPLKEEEIRALQEDDGPEDDVEYVDEEGIGARLRAKLAKQGKKKSIPYVKVEYETEASTDKAVDPFLKYRSFLSARLINDNNEA